MHSPNSNKTGNSPSASSHHRLREQGRQDEKDSTNVMSYNKPSRLDSLRMFLHRSKSSHHPPSSSAACPDAHKRLSVQIPVSSPDEIRSSHLPQEPKSQPESKSTERPVRRASQSTRGLFVPAYRSPEKFSHSCHRRSLEIPLPIHVKQGSQVFVGFYNCENFTIGRKLLTSPDINRVISAAVAFLGECQLRDVPEELIPKHPNPAYRGLSLESSHGGYHLHYPSYAGVQPFLDNASADWSRLMLIHARNFPDTVLLIGVGLGEPGTQCC
ncbi:hypothetical protein F4860DRAFT_521877 [Xylaria cubensis]|nr:hypothetical protein F4860DRAFT_521877 [Xylaria cubensis]